MVGVGATSSGAFCATDSISAGEGSDETEGGAVFVQEVKMNKNDNPTNPQLREMVEFIWMILTTEACAAKGRGCNDDARTN